MATASPYFPECAHYPLHQRGRQPNTLEPFGQYQLSDQYALATTASEQARLLAARDALIVGNMWYSTAGLIMQGGFICKTSLWMANITIGAALPEILFSLRVNQPLSLNVVGGVGRDGGSGLACLLGSKRVVV